MNHSTQEQKAIALSNQGRFQEAEAIYRALISAGTTNHMTYGNLAVLCGMSGRFDELIKLLRKALELEPDFPEAHNTLGIAFKKQYHLDAAIASYKTALQIKYNTHSSLQPWHCFA